MTGQSMIPLGYMLKQVVAPPDWMKSPGVVAVQSLSNCLSPAFADYIPLWKHNGWWLFNTPRDVRDAASGVDTDGTLQLFYYEAYPQQFDGAGGDWQDFQPDESFPTAVMPPQSARLSGFDVVSFYIGTAPECSPLSCNGLAAELPVNERCLFETLEDARAALERGAFKDTEPGPYRIVAVYEVDDMP